MAIIIKRMWEMPNSNTFDIKCINKLIHKYYNKEMMSIDPFANKSKLATKINDLNPEYKTDYNLDALDFLKIFNNHSIDFVFYDPPYSLRQVSECYKGFGIEVTQETTQGSWRRKHMDEIKRVLKANGLVISFGWNSNGVGKGRGFKIIEMLIIAHGGGHNDTIVTVERKFRNELF